VNIRELHVEGFGRWNELTLRGFEPGLNVVYGPNESGKTTLLEFIRTVLFGFTPERRQRYAFSKADGMAGGSLVLSQNGRLRTLTRREGPGGADYLRLSEPDGSMHQRPAQASYVGVDEKVFCQVFAVGLRELQELATLSDADVASRLYELGAGSDRSALIAAVRELRQARQRLLGSDWRTSPIGVLAERAQRLRAEIDSLTGLSARHAHAAAGYKEASAALPTLESSLAELQSRLRIADAAAAVGDRLRQRIDCLRELEALGPAPELPDDLARRLEVCKDHIRRRRRKIRELKQQRENVRAEIEKLEVNERWLRQAPQLAALAEQADWAAAETKRIADLQRQVDALRAQVTAGAPDEPRRPSVEEAEPALLRRHISPRDIKQLKSLDAALRAAAQADRQTQADAARLEQAAAAAAERLETALKTRSQRDLHAALEKAGQRVHELRRRVQLDQRIGHMEATLVDTGQEDFTPLEEPLLSVGSLVGLGAFFVMGMPLIFAWAVLSGPLSWLLGFLGVAGVGAGIALKFWRDKRGTRKIELATGESESLRRQIDEAIEQAKQLDQRLSVPPGKAADRLREAEKQLMELERLLPLDDEAQAAQAQAADARAAAEQATQTRQKADEDWTAALRELRLDEGLTYQQVCDLYRAREDRTPSRSAGSGIAILQQQLQAQERALQEARQGQQEYTLRVQRAFQELGLGVPSGLTSAKLQEIRKEIVRQDELFRRRQEQMNQLRRLRRRVIRLCLQGKRWARRRRWLLRQAGVTSEVEFYRRLQAFARHDELRAKLADLEREINSRLCGTATLEETTSLLRETSAERLAEMRHALRGQLHGAQQRLAEQRQRRDELETDLKRLGKDTTPAEKRLELAAVEEQLAQAARQWQELAAGSFFLDKVRHVYERERQPEVLRDASQYLATLTDQKYTRVWTPLDEEALRVDAADGKTLGVELLSTGTREQLFLCLRLALARSYAKRGIELPFVLDDVLVNFDTRRSLAAARLLRDYAASGQQLLLFTCHEHIAHIFQALEVKVQTLPDSETELPPAPLFKPSPGISPSRREPLLPAAPASAAKPAAAKDAWAA
jgi:uncharacterized protein YhaN